MDIIPYLDLLPVMDLPTPLLRMLETSCANDTVKNWNIYQEADGNYVFKIRFSQIQERHIENSSPIPGVSKSSRCSYKQKSDRQVNRDNERHKNWQERRVTRSQTAKQSNEQACVNSTGISSRLDCSIEDERHNSLQFDVATPEFTPLKMNMTDREITNVPVDNSSVVLHDLNIPQYCNSDCPTSPGCKFDDSFSAPGNCHPGCMFGSMRNTGYALNLYDCTKCGESRYSVCEPCLRAGGHACHLKHLKLHVRFK